MTITVSANNGTAPASALSPMPGRNGDGSQQTSPHTTVASYGRLREAMRAAGMGDLLPSNGWSCYRSRAAQQHMRNIGLTTIPVGQSIHGEWTWGSAVDFQGLGGFGAARHNWLRANGGPLGWYQPGWAQAGGSLPEPWHWEYDQRQDTRNGEDDMPSAQEVADAVWNYALRRANGPVADAGTYLVDTRILLGDPAAPLVRVADAVWSAVIDRPNGPSTDAGTYLVDTRATVGPVDRGPVPLSQQVWDFDLDRPGTPTTDAGTYMTETALASGAVPPEMQGRGHHHRDPEDMRVHLHDSDVQRIAVAVAAILSTTDHDPH